MTYSIVSEAISVGSWAEILFEAEGRVDAETEYFSALPESRNCKTGNFRVVICILN